MWGGSYTGGYYISFFSRKSEMTVSWLSVVFTYLSDNNHWCDFRISLPPAEYAEILTCSVTACLLFSHRFFLLRY